MKNVIDSVMLKELRRNPKKTSDFDWYILCSHYELDESFIREFKDYLNWEQVCLCQKMSNNFLLEMKNYLSWNFLGAQNYCFDLIMDNQENINWKMLLEKRMFSSEELDEIVQNVEMKIEDWISIFCCQHLEEEWIERYWFEFPYPALIWEKQTLSDRFFRSNFNYIKKSDWKDIFKNQILSDTFINQYGKRFDYDTWQVIFKYQYLSPKIRKKWEEIVNEKENTF